MLKDVAAVLSKTPIVHVSFNVKSQNAFCKLYVTMVTTLLL